MTVNYTGGSRQAHRRFARKQQLDATGAPTYSVAAANRAAGLHLASLRNRPLTASMRTSASTTGFTRPSFDFSFAQENVGQQRRDSAMDQMMPQPIASSSAAGSYEAQRRRILATRDWAGLSSTRWKPPRPADLSLTEPAKRPRTRSPSPIYTPLSPPPIGGYLRGSSADPATDADAEDEDEEEMSVEPAGDYSSEIEDAVILLPERDEYAHAGEKVSFSPPKSRFGLDLSNAVNPPSKPRSDSLPGTHAFSTASSPEGSPKAHFQWSARKRLGNAAAALDDMPTRPTRYQAPSLLAKVDEGAENDLLKDLSGVRRLSLADQDEPAGMRLQQAGDSLEIVDFSPRHGNVDLPFTKVDVLNSSNADSPGDRSELPAEQEAVSSKPATSTPPASQPASYRGAGTARASSALVASEETSSYERVCPKNESNTPAPDLDLEAIRIALNGYLPAPPNLSPVHHLAHSRDESALHMPDDLVLGPPFASFEGDYLLVSEHMGLGCEGLTAEQADDLCMREMAMRESGIMPLEWYAADEGGSDAEEGTPLAAKTDGNSAVHGSIADGYDDDDDDEDWDPEVDELDRNAPIQIAKRVIPGLLFEPDDETGILEP
ncbi:hypothetical protein JCM10908_005069 [Rhodotorula pacifica]|uniref:uncharacterized protein n=1 Tax=Rhodotorula pacifica TaxID=1495444 RepID=UPI00316B086E